MFSLYLYDNGVLLVRPQTDLLMVVTPYMSRLCAWFLACNPSCLKGFRMFTTRTASPGVVLSEQGSTILCIRPSVPRKDFILVTHWGVKLCQDYLFPSTGCSVQMMRPFSFSHPRFPTYGDLALSKFPCIRHRSPFLPRAALGSACRFCDTPDLILRFHTAFSCFLRHLLIFFF